MRIGTDTMGGYMKQKFLIITIILCTSVWTAEFALPEVISNQSTANRFVFSDHTVKDKRTGLTWTRDANIGKRRWQGALDLIKELNSKQYAGFADWRLPGIEDFETLRDYAAGVGCDGDSRNNSGVFNGLAHIHFNRIGFYDVQDDFYWSSSIPPESPEQAFVVQIRSGSAADGANKKKYNYGVWPVRSGP